METIRISCRTLWDAAGPSNKQNRLSKRNLEKFPNKNRFGGPEGSFGAWEILKEIVSKFKKTVCRFGGLYVGLGGIFANRKFSEWKVGGGGNSA